MPNTRHTVAAGDTYETLSSRYYGEPSQAGRIRAANPGSPFVLVPGATLLIPAARGDEAGASGDGFRFRVAGVEFAHASKITWTRRLDAVDSVEIVAPLAETRDFRRAFQPLTFPDLDAFEDGTRVFSGVMVTAVPVSTVDGSTVTIAGYSRPGVLGDCHMPPGAYPIRFRGLGLAEIARQIADPFSVTVAPSGDLGGPFRYLKLQRNDKPWAFLTDLAQKRGALLRSDAAGRLVIAAAPAPGRPVATLREGESPIRALTVSFDPQRYYSHVTGVRPTRRGEVGARYTVVNTAAVRAGVVRPTVVTLDDITRGELQRATEAAAGRMFAGAVSYTLTIPSWRSPEGGIWAPGDTLELEFPSVFVYSSTRFQLKEAELRRSSTDGETAVLTLMLPGAYGGAPPDMLPWEA